MYPLEQCVLSDIPNHLLFSDNDVYVSCADNLSNVLPILKNKFD